MISEISSPDVARLELPLSQAIRAGDYVYTSGHIAARPDGTIVTGDFAAETRAVLDNVRAVVRAAGGTLADVCKVTAYLFNATLFEPFNDVYREYFTAPYPARSTVLAPLSNPDLRIEVEAVVYLPQ